MQTTSRRIESCTPVLARPTRGGRIVDTKRILRSLGIASPPDLIVRLIDQALGVAEFETLCAGAGVSASNADVRGQIADVFAAAGIRWKVKDESGGADLSRAGPLVFYGNHPYGFADALIGLSTALAHRPDTKVLANGTVAAFDFYAAHTIRVDLGSGEKRLATNRTALRDTLRHLRAGGSLLIFPSQICAHLRLPACRVTDPAWSPHLLSLIDLSGATSVPLYFHGHNSWRFQLLGLIHPVFRTLLLLREFIALKGRRIEVCMGAPLNAVETAIGEPVAERMRRLRERLYALRAAGLDRSLADQ
jgi:putative hemolysin